MTRMSPHQSRQGPGRPAWPEFSSLLASRVREERSHYGAGTLAHVEPPTASKSDQAGPCLVQRRNFATMEPLQLDASNISDPSRGTSLSFSGSWSRLSRRQGIHFLYGGLRLIKILNRSHSSIRWRPQNFPRTCPPCSWRATALFCRSFASLVQNLVTLRNKGVITSIV